tara:strand:+ start:1107 stop:1499 length:393 start_codon:yes stop_codon:yes gene_type:complete
MKLLFTTTFLLFGFLSLAQETYSIPKYLSENQKLDLLKSSFSDCAKKELNEVYRLLKGGLLRERDYKLKKDFLMTDAKSSGDIFSYINTRNFDLNKLPEKISIFFGEYQFKFIINGKQMNTYALYNFLKR